LRRARGRVGSGVAGPPRRPPGRAAARQRRLPRGGRARRPSPHRDALPPGHASVGARHHGRGRDRRDRGRGPAPESYFLNSSPRRIGSVGPEATSSTLPPAPTLTVSGTRAILNGRLNSRFGARSTGNETGRATKNPGGSWSSITATTFTPGGRRS